MRVYGRGIVRRLPPMLDGDPRRIRMVYSLLFSLPGTPVLFYGEEIGMGENPAQEGRHGGAHADAVDRRARTAASRGRRRAGSSRRRPSDGYAPEHVNVEAQMHDPDSLLAFIRELAVRYRSSPEIGWGALDVLPSGQRRRARAPHHRRRRPVRRACTTSRRPRPWCRSSSARSRPTRMLSDLFAVDRYDLDERGRIDVHLDAYGYRWFRIVEPDDRRLT